MKKLYEKPQVYMERFELAEHIAGCSLIMNSGSETTCNASGTINGNPVFLFLDESICTDQEGHFIDSQAYCYTNGSISIANINS